MHIHYFTLRKIAHLLNEKVSNGIAGEIFTQTRDELVVGLGSPAGDLYLRISCSPQLTYVWPVNEFAKARRNVADLFPVLPGKAFLGARVLAWERVLILSFEDGHELILKMHGNHSNVLLRQGGVVTEMFRNQLDVDLDWVEPDTRFDETLTKAEQVEDVAAHLKKISPALDKRFAERVQREMDGGKSFAAAYSLMLAEAEGDTCWIHRIKGKIEFLVISPDAGDALTVQGVQQALMTFLKSSLQYRQYFAFYSQAEKAVKTESQRLTGQIASYKTSIQNLDDSRSGEEIGSILMAFMHEVPAGAAEVTLEDFYSEGRIRIKLNPQLSPQQNAERYFQKQKDRKKQKQHLLEVLEAFEKEWSTFSPCADAFALLTPPSAMALTPQGIDHRYAKEMTAYLKTWGELLGLSESEAGEKKRFFFEFEKEGWKIFVGRNSKNNDELTFGFSSKEDLWLHARDVTGSHVILQRKGKDFPRHIIEYAASLAAGYSKRKGEALVAVQYTLRKYVRKLKGGPPGKVIVDREEVLLVEPAKR